MEMQNEIEKRNIKVRVKNKCKEKYNLRIDEIQKQFKIEIEKALDAYYKAKEVLSKRDQIVKKLTSIIVR